MNRWGAVTLVLLGVLLGSPHQARPEEPLLPGEQFAVGAYPVSVTLADLNGDGVLDVVTGDNGTSADISVLLGSGVAQPQPSSVPLLSALTAGVLVSALFALGAKAARRRGRSGRKVLA